jgi:uncharacterized membrane protein
MDDREFISMKAALRAMEKRVAELEAKVTQLEGGSAGEQVEPGAQMAPGRQAAPVPGSEPAVPGPQMESRPQTEPGPQAVPGPQTEPGAPVQPDLHAGSLDAGKSLSEQLPEANEGTPAHLKSITQPEGTPETELQLGAPGEATQSVESRIGTYWLQRIGTALVVIGIASLIAYSFNYWGPVLKIAIGYLVSFALIGLAEWLESKKGMSWYGRGLAGGGWSLAYFTTYAMHNVPSVAILPSAGADLALLMLVAAGALAHAVYRQSEIIAILSVVLADITICQGTPNVLTALSLAILVVVVAVLGVHRQWYRLFGFGLLTTYGACSAALVPVLTTGFTSMNAAVASLLTISWLAFSWVNLNLPADNNERRSITVGTVFINNLAFMFGMANVLHKMIEGNAGLLPLSVGVVCLGIACLAGRKQFDLLKDVETAMGLTFVTAAIPMLSGSMHSTLVWPLETLVLLALGVKYQLVVVRRFSYALLMITWIGALISNFDTSFVDIAGVSAKWTVVCEGLSALAYAAAAFVIFRLPASDAFKHTVESRVAFHFFAIACSSLLWMLATTELAASERAIAWALESGALLYIGLRFEYQFFRWLAGIGAMALTFSLFDVHGYPSWLTWGWLGILYLCFAWLRVRSVRLSRSFAESYYYFCLALVDNLVLLSFTPDEVRAPLMAIESLLGIVIGFQVKDNAIRALSVIGLLISGGVVLATAANAEWLASLCVIAAVFAGGYVYSRPNLKVLVTKGSEATDDLLFSWGSLLFTVVVAQKLPAQWLAVCWALQGAASLAAGFLYRRKSLRIAGLLVFLLLVGKLLFVDLSGAATVLRIVSFIVAGAVLLACSYGYARFAGKAGEDAPSKDAGGQSS